MSNTRATDPRWVLPPLLRREDVERWLAGIPGSATSVAVHVGEEGCTTAPGAAAALQSALALLDRRGVELNLTFPPGTLTADRIGRAFEVNPPPGPLAVDPQAHTKAERTFAHRLSGLVLAQICAGPDSIDRLPEVRDRQARFLRENDSIFGSGKDRVIAVIGSNDTRERLRTRPYDRQLQLESLLLKLLGTSKYHPSGQTPAMNELVEFVYQATENTFDHGRRDFDGNPIRQVRFVSFERHQVGTGAGARPIESLAPDRSSPLADYLHRLQRWTAGHGGRPERMQVWSVSVADGGIGIAAKMAGGYDVFHGDLQVEFKHVQAAVLPDGTTKPPGEGGRGSGLVKMMRACHRLGGIFEIRTGRLSLHRTYLDADGTTPRTDFVSRESDGFDLHGGDDEQEMLAGTVTTLVFPRFDLEAGRSRDGDG